MKITFEKGGCSDTQYLGSAQEHLARQANSAAEMYYILTPLQRSAVRLHLGIKQTGRSSLERYTALLQQLKETKATLLY